MFRDGRTDLAIALLPGPISASRMIDCVGSGPDEFWDGLPGSNLGNLSRK
jgi:hypothetical protein